MKKPESSKNVPYRRELGDSLVLKTAVDEADVERVAAFDDIIFGEEEVGAFCRSLFLNHPHTQMNDLIFVEDEKTCEVVSSLCLIPWQWQYEDVTLKVGELGIVGTLEQYRRRGLIRAQVEYFRELLAERDFVLSQIQGIPYFYRQFDYEYALPLVGGYRIELSQIPDLGEGGKPRFTCRPEVASDLPALKRLYQEASQDLAIHTQRDDAIWQYLSDNSDPECITFHEGWTVEDENGQVIGYFHISKHPFTPALTINEVSRLDYEAALAVLRHLKRLSMERKNPNILLSLPENCVLMQLARYHQAYDSGTYALQIHIPDMVRFLSAIAPVLERRLAGSPFAGLTERIGLNFYRETAMLSFTDGKITQVEPGTAADCPIRIPPRAAIKLVLGYRSREELSASWPDLGMPPRFAYLVDILFPEMTSYIYTTY